METVGLAGFFPFCCCEKTSRFHAA